MKIFFRTGERAIQNAHYEVVDTHDNGTGVVLAISAGSPFPPFQNRAVRYRIHEAIDATYSTASSGASLDRVTIQFPHALDYLAKR